MLIDELKPTVIVRGPIFPEPVQVIVAVSMGDSVKLVGKGLNSNQVHEPILSAEQVAQLESTPEKEPFDGDPLRFRLGVEALRLGLAYEYDPYFSLSIARVDPLPHQLEAVYDYFLAMPRIRFLLADDPGAGKTIMAGLLLKELKIRGLVKRTLIITPASLSFQWQREMKEKFREQFEVIRGDVLRANYGMNPWQERIQVVTSISWVSRIEDAKDSLLRSRWDLIIVDEAHKMAAYSADKKTLAYRLGESLSAMTDHFLLMTATPHKGDPENFCLFLELLDRDVYGNVKSLEEAMRRNYAPFYLRRTKEALVSFPDPETGRVKKLFTDRAVRTASFALDGEEYDFYDALTRYVEDQSIKAAQEDTPRSRALTFTMAMLQRRFASSIYAVHRSLERMRDKRRKILEDPREYLRKQLEIPEDLDDLTEEERDQYIEEIENAAISFDPTTLKEDIAQITRLIDQARALEQREVESKLAKLKKVLAELLQNNQLRSVYHGDHSLRTLKELVRSYLTITKDLSRVMTRVKAIYRGWAIPCTGKQVYASRHRAEWLGKISEPGVRRRAEFYYQQLDALRVLRREVRRDLLAESKKHKAWKRLCEIPSMGPIRAAVLLGILQTPHRFRTKRQLWTHSGLGIEVHSSADHQVVKGQLERKKKHVEIRGLNQNCNHDLKNLFKGAAVVASTKPGAFEEFYAALLAKGMRPEMARLTLARKIATIVLIVWKKGVRFDAQHLKPQTA